MDVRVTVWHTNKSSTQRRLV